MSLKNDPPFDYVLKISEEGYVDTAKLSLRRLREVVAGRDTSFSRSQSFTILRNTDFPNRHRDFEAVLENEKESPEIRYLAALALGKIATPAAMDILVKNSHVRDERVLAGVMKALGWIGNKSALKRIPIAKKRGTGLAASAAEFAATLIAHREGLEGTESPGIETQAYLEIDPQCARPIRIIQADDADAEFCLRSLAYQPYGIEYSEQPMYQVRCGQNTMMILINRDFSDNHSIKMLERRKAFLGVVAIRNETTQWYSVTYIILTSPAKGKDTVNILIYRTNGKLTFRGTARVVNNSAEFAIDALSRPGAFPVKIEGTFEDGRLDIKTALSTAYVQVKKQEPSEERRPYVQREMETEQRQSE